MSFSSAQDHRMLHHQRLKGKEAAHHCHDAASDEYQEREDNGVEGEGEDPGPSQGEVG
eukprot:CAMPEP_0178423416 /NCGR_PEP_ID=MMETSP0689_2-20121128/27678_1 /TAXON_ID=160604 /ORGANISM="Amphidinium massartii, Strain CS-259" /LENGTH=57 /DNA_ID=CAMNT_0020045011 /DNA_START=22 /DNA_END=195 /DNA_ORIENTATION=-